tara:strand:+ start:2930 stop:3166 length:237 start_codon:yes stop_codon:yes gene_type:complete
VTTQNKAEAEELLGHFFEQTLLLVILAVEGRMATIDNKTQKKGAMKIVNRVKELLYEYTQRLKEEGEPEVDADGSGTD